ncbi:hypothetical protein GCM10023088_57340 [Actinomadura verrucosospora]
MGDDQVTARCQARQQVGDQLAGLVVVDDVVEDSQQHQRDRLVEVQGGGGAGQDGAGVADVGLDVVADPLPGVLVNRARAWVRTSGPLST